MRPRPVSASLPLFLLLPLALVFPLAPALPLAAQSGPDLMRRAAAAHEERMAGVENVTIVQDVMGMENTLYMERRDVGGTPTLVPVESAVAGMTVPVPEVNTADWSTAFQEDWIERFRLEGTQAVDGRNLHVLVIDDMSGLDVPEMGNARFHPTRSRYLLDPDNLIVRGMTMDGEIEGGDGQRVPFQMEMGMDDYREIDGYLHPFVTRVRSSGMMAAADIDQDEMRTQLARMREQFESMPENQRAMMGGMLEEQMERIEAMMGDDGSMEMVITVRELRVNAGPPAR